MKAIYLLPHAWDQTSTSGQAQGEIPVLFAAFILLKESVDPAIDFGFWLLHSITPLTAFPTPLIPEAIFAIATASRCLHEFDTQIGVATHVQGRQRQ